MSTDQQKGKVLRWGILGCGKICRDFVLAQRLSNKPHKIQAVSTSNSVERAKKFCEELDLKDTAYYGSYEELLNDPNIDVIYIGVWNNKHKEWTIKTLEAGKNVLCEKPMGCNSKEVICMVEKARQKNLFFMEAFWSRCFPAWLHIRELIKTQKYGPVKMCHANFAVGLPDTRKCLDEAETPIMDIGVYTIMFSMFVFEGKQPENLTVTSQKNSQGCDIWANITLEFGEGKHACIYYNSDVFSPTNAFICFEKALVQIPEFFWCPNRLVVREYPVSANQSPEQLDFPLKDEELADKFIFNNSSGLHYEADHVYDRIQAGHKESDLISLNESVEIHKLIDRIREKVGVSFPQDK